MKIILPIGFALVLSFLVVVYATPWSGVTYIQMNIQTQEAKDDSKLNSFVRSFLLEKKSPLVSETEFLLQQKHWKLLIAISAIESQYCIRQLGNNCWGIGGEENYRQYSSIRAAIADANDLIENWQQKGKWLTVEDMNCHYVVPCNSNWVSVVNEVLEQLDQYER